MQYRSHKDFNLSEIGVGCYGLSGVFGSVDVAEFKRMLVRAYDLGVNLFDTADIYGSAEELLGEVVKPFRQEVYLASKVGGGRKQDARLNYEYINQACNQSLRNLQTDVLDLYHIHFDDPTTPVEETLDALEQLVTEGKIRSYGVSHLPPSRIEAYCEKGNPFSVMVELSLVSREARENLLPLCIRYGVGVIAFSVTGRGLLSGKIKPGDQFDHRDIRQIDPLFQRERLESALRIVDKLTSVGANLGKTPIQFAIAWVLAQPGVVCALTGPSTIPHLEENVAGSGWRIDPQGMVDLDRFLSEESERLSKAQRHTVQEILTQPLPSDISQAFKDLVYAFETSIQIRMVQEDQILPLFMELFELRKHLDMKAFEKMVRIQGELARIIE